MNEVEYKCKIIESRVQSRTNHNQIRNDWRIRIEYG